MHQKIFSAIENLIYKGMLANPITAVATAFATMVVVVNSSISDTLIINFNVTNKGHIVLGKMSNESLISDLNLLVDSIFKITVLELPKLYPAIKRGQPVNTKFILPILISTTQ